MLTDIEASRWGAGGGDVISTVGSGRGQRGSARLEEGGRPRHVPVTTEGSREEEVDGGVARLA
jgi:hypothetical protein